MENSEPSPALPPDNWAGLFNSWDRTLRLLIFLICLALGIGGVVLATVYLSRTAVEGLAGQLTVSTTGTGLAISYSNTNNNVTILTVPASQLWYDTQLDLDPNETAHITAAGRVHLAVGRLVDGARCLGEVTYHWVAPDGSTDESSSPPPSRDSRHELMLDIDRPIGALLGYLSSATNPQPTPENARIPVNKIKLIGKTQDIINPGPEKAHLWLVVNDWVLSDTDSARKAFVHDSAFLEEHYNNYDGCGNRPHARNITVAQEQDTFKRLVATRHWNVFYEDNIGTYQVVVETQKPRK